MESNVIQRHQKRLKRAIRVRKHLHGTASKPRLTVFKSNRHLAAQLIDDDKGQTLVSASTLAKALKKRSLGSSKEAAKVIGEKIAELAKEKDITTCIFDRGCYKFHGVIAAIAQAARENGLQF